MPGNWSRPIGRRGELRFSWRSREQACVAVENNDLELAEWCLAHGATPNAAPPPDQRFPQSSLYSRAVRLGHDQVADRLLRAGAREEDVALDDEEQFVVACLGMDQAAIDALLTRQPEYL